MEQNISFVPQNALCTACGACAAVCGKNAVIMEENTAGYLTARIDVQKCVDCGLCRKVCPSVPENQTINDVSAVLRGSFLESFIGHAADKMIRREGQSGGVVTALLLYLLESGKIDGAVTNQFDPEHRMSKAVYVANRRELLESVGSYYVQSSVVQAVRQAPEGAKTAAVVLGCQAEALRMMERKGLPVPDYLIDLVCEGTYSRRMLSDMIASTDCPQEEQPRQFRFRYSHPAYGGWPGNALLVTDKHRYRIDKSVRFALKPLYESYRCLLCYEQINTHADLVCGDPWGVPGDHLAGETVVMARTEKGLALLKEAQAAGYIALAPLDTELFVKGQQIDTRIRSDVSAGYVCCQCHQWAYPYSVTGKAAQMFSTVSSKARKAYDRRLTYTRARSLARDETEVRALEAIYRAELEKKERRNAQKARLKMPIRAVRFALCKLRRK